MKLFGKKTQDAEAKVTEPEKKKSPRVASKKLKKLGTSLKKQFKKFGAWVKKHRKKILITSGIIVATAIIAIAAWQIVFKVIIPSKNYKEANSLIKNQDYEKAYEKLRSVGDYEDAKEMKKDFLWLPVSHTSTYSNIQGEFTTTFDYDENGNCIMQITSNSDGDQSTVENTYDEKGNCIKRVSTDKYETKTTQYSYVYEGENIVQMTVDSNAATITSKFTYDNNGNCIKTVTVMPGGKENTQADKYDKNGKRIKSVVKTASGYEETTAYTYDKNGNCIKEETKNKNGEIKETVSCSYNSNDELIHRSVTDIEGNVETVEYTLDKYGNCKKSVSTDAAGVTTTIEYDEYKVFYLKD